MDIKIKQLRNAKVIELEDEKEVVLKLTEMDGSKTEIKIPAESYEMLEEAIVENWLEKQKV